MGRQGRLQQLRDRSRSSIKLVQHMQPLSARALLPSCCVLRSIYNGRGSRVSFFVDRGHTLWEVWLFPLVLVLFLFCSSSVLLFYFEITVINIWRKTSTRVGCCKAAGGEGNIYLRTASSSSDVGESDERSVPPSSTPAENFTVWCTISTHSIIHIMSARAVGGFHDRAGLPDKPRNANLSLVSLHIIRTCAYIFCWCSLLDVVTLSRISRAGLFLSYTYGTTKHLDDALTLAILPISLLYSSFDEASIPITIYIKVSPWIPSLRAPNSPCPNPCQRPNCRYIKGIQL